MNLNRKKEESKLSYSVYNNLVYTNLNNIKYDNGDEKISIIIPTHNHFEQLSELINSIFKQTYTNFEIILIDDLSYDETNEFFSKYHDNLLKYYIIMKI